MAACIRQMPTKVRKSTTENTMTEATQDQFPEEIEAPDQEAPDQEAPDQEAPDQEAPESEQPDRLTGQALLEFYDEKKAAGKSHSEIAFAAGYCTRTRTGQERVMIAQFNAAMLAAQGVDVGDRGSGAGRSHAGLTKARVSGGGLLLVSQLATRHVKAMPGSVFDVEYPAEGQILLTLTNEVKPVVARKPKEEKPQEEPGTPLLDQQAA